MHVSPKVPKGHPKPISGLWGLTASIFAVLVSLFLWTQYPSGKGRLIFGANTILYACVLAHWVKSRKKRHLTARVIVPDQEGASTETTNH